METKKFEYDGVNYNVTGIKDEHIFRQIGGTRLFYEFGLLKYIQELNITGTYVDVGANIGNHSMFFANHCNSTNVISFEPEKTCFILLNQNMQNNSTKNFDVHNKGVWDENKKMFLEQFESQKNMGMSKISEDETKNGYFVDLIRLDDIVNDNVGLIKIDVEGGELKVLNGAIEIIKRDNPVIICEASTIEEFNVLNDFLLPLGYIKPMKKFNATPTYVWLKT